MGQRIGGDGAGLLVAATAFGVALDPEEEPSQLDSTRIAGDDRCQWCSTHDALEGGLEQVGIGLVLEEMRVAGRWLGWIVRRRQLGILQPVG